MATITSNYVKSAVGAMSRQGFETDVLLKQAGINPLLTENPNWRVSDVQMTRLVQLVWKELSDEFMGFTSTPCRMGTFATMVESVYRCDTLREALHLGIRFYNLMTHDIETRLIDRADQTDLTVSFSEPELDPNYFYHEFWLVIWHRFASWLIGKKIPLVGASLSYPKPAHASELNHLFPCHQEFGAADNRLILDSSYLSYAPIRSKEEVYNFLKNSPADLMTIPGEDLSLSYRIATMIKSHHQTHYAFPSLHDVATELTISTQSLHRRLKREGTHFQEIKDKIRRDMAITKLIQERYPVHKISDLLGFSEPRSFTRAFKDWTGLSPREYRRYS